jgi:hypothetical protein
LDIVIEVTFLFDMTKPSNQNHTPNHLMRCSARLLVPCASSWPIWRQELATGCCCHCCYHQPPLLAAAPAALQPLLRGHPQPLLLPVLLLLLHLQRRMLCMLHWAATPRHQMPQHPSGDLHTTVADTVSHT